MTKLIDLREKRRDRRIADSLKMMTECRALKDELLTMIGGHIHDDGPSNEAIAGTVARVLVQFCSFAEMSEDAIKQLLSEELNGYQQTGG